jgi:GNAT superfamily N-acetyltransferase
MFVWSSGLWFGIKLWWGKSKLIILLYTEHRKKGIGKMMTDYVEQKQRDRCMIVLDAFTGNYTASFLLQPRIYS